MNQKRKFIEKEKKIKIGIMWSQTNCFITIFLILMLFLASCLPDNYSIDCKQIESVKAYYLPKELDPSIPISDCNYIFNYSPVLEEIIISDQNLICDLTKIINNLKVSNKKAYLDFRVKIVLETKSGDIHYLCVGEDDLVLFDGVIMENERKLFEFIDNVLYP